jgi:dTMP kinase
MLITFEGIDNSGKSLQAKLLFERLRRYGVRAVLFREPGGCELSEAIREILLDRRYHRMGPRTEALLYSAARAQLVAEKIRPALARDEVVISDRYYDSTTAYQGYGRSLSVDFLQRLSEFATDGLAPDKTFLLDLEPEEAVARKKKEGDHDDRMEAEELDFHRRLRQGYLKIAGAEPHRIRVIDATKTVSEIESEVWSEAVCLLQFETGASKGGVSPCQ